MIERFSQVDPDAAADAITKEYVEVTVAVASRNANAGAGEFFGRIDEVGPRSGQPATAGTSVGGTSRTTPTTPSSSTAGTDRRAVLRATVANPLGLATGDGSRWRTARSPRTSTSSSTTQTAMSRAAFPDHVLAEIGAARTGRHARDRRHDPGRAGRRHPRPADLTLIVLGGPGTGKTAVGLHRAAFLLFEHRRRLSARVSWSWVPTPFFLDYIANVLPSLGERSVQQRTVLDLCVPKVELRGTTMSTLPAARGAPEMLALLDAAIRSGVRPPDEGCASDRGTDSGVRA